MFHGKSKCRSAAQDPAGNICLYTAQSTEHTHFTFFFIQRRLQPGARHLQLHRLLVVALSLLQGFGSKHQGMTVFGFTQYSIAQTKKTKINLNIK